MDFAIHRTPHKVLLAGLAGLSLYFTATVLFLRSNEYFVLFLGGGVLGLFILIVKSVGTVFVSSLTVTDSSIETVTSVGGIIKIDFDKIDWARSSFSDLGLVLTPTSGEPLVISVFEYSRKDLARLMSHLIEAISGEGARGEV